MFGAPQGGEKLQEAYYILQELAEKFGHTVQLLNALAVYHMLAGKYDEAQRLLNEALGKSANDPDTLFFMFYYQQGTYAQYLAACAHDPGMGKGSVVVVVVFFSL